MEEDNSLGDHKAQSKLKNRGGKGQEGIAVVDGSVLTVKENAAVALAKDILDDARRGTGKEIKNLNLMEIAKYAQGRSEGKPCSDAEVLAECMRIQNHKIYGDSVARR